MLKVPAADDGSRAVAEMRSKTATLGCYAFVTPDWSEADYPLDLWLKYHSGLFDQVAVITYGRVPLPVSLPNVVTRTISGPERDMDPFNYYVVGKQTAQDLLETDWKFLVDIDEFVTPTALNFELDERFAYKLTYRHLWGNLRTEIRNNGFPRNVARAHFGRRLVTGDGAQVDGPCNEKPIGQFWHTGAARNPHSLSQKWRTQLESAAAAGIRQEPRRLRYLEDPFDYRKYRAIWPGSYLLSIDETQLPGILRQNRERFRWCLFDPPPPSDDSLTAKFLEKWSGLRRRLEPNKLLSG